MVTVVKEKTAAKKTNTREGFVRKRGNALKQETQNELERFRDYLREQEKSSHTIEKYCRDVRKFLMFAGEEWDKNTIISEDRNTVSARSGCRSGFSAMRDGK